MNNNDSLENLWIWVVFWGVMSTVTSHLLYVPWWFATLTSEAGFLLVGSL
jgi:hypothetical protein